MKVSLRLFFFLVCALLHLGIVAESPARNAILSQDYRKLIEISNSTTNEGRIAREYLSAVDYNQFCYNELNYFLEQLSLDSPLRKTIMRVRSEKELSILSHISTLTGEELSKYSQENDSHNPVINAYVRCLENGLDSLTFLELKYLKMTVPTFDSGLIASRSEARRDEVNEQLLASAEAFRQHELQAMDFFLLHMKYVMLNEFHDSYKEFVKEHAASELASKPQDMHNELVKMMYKHWGADSFNKILKRELSQFCRIVDSARSNYLDKMGIVQYMPISYNLPALEGYSIRLDMNGFNRIARLRNDLEDSRTTSSIVSLIFGFLTGWGFIADVGKALYDSGELTDEARNELPYREDYLRKLFNETETQTNKMLNAVSASLVEQQKKHSTNFYNYVIQNY